MRFGENAKPFRFKTSTRGAADATNGIAGFNLSRYLDPKRSVIAASPFAQHSARRWDGPCIDSSDQS
jgi:hypothetical protein